MHSKFNSAVNFISGGAFVFVVNESVGPGPLNIVIKGIAPMSVNSLVIENRVLFLNDTKLDFEVRKLYDPIIYLLEFDYNNFNKNLLFLENLIRKSTSPLSLAFLLDSERKTKFSSTFESEYVKRIDMGVHEILFGNILSGIRMIRGLGPGLTPSGDDFNSGILIALSLIGKISSSDMQDTIKLVLQEAVGSNLFTNAFLLCASQGLLFYKFRELINAVLYSDENDVLNKTESVLLIGETSGADQLVGFLIGMKRFLL
ncbi:MAG: DUF2877 domain-containing protein [Ignavibacteriaceae bacterium]|nr:DUF2877 domain-containing protein [Ignavibacteriaceae bacterium]